VDAQQGLDHAHQFLDQIGANSASPVSPLDIDTKKKQTVCSSCSKPLHMPRPLVCSVCKGAHYCGRSCQARHWKAVHKRKCKATAQAPRALDLH
jgi:hypothetical protein